MSKKNKKKYSDVPDFLSARMITNDSKKHLNKKMKHAIKDIENYQIHLMEVDKKHVKRKDRKNINKKESEFLQDMYAIKERRKMAKEWEKTGFFDYIIDFLNDVGPIVKLIAKAICSLIITFLSVESIKSHISSKMLSKIVTAYNIASII